LNFEIKKFRNTTISKMFNICVVGPANSGKTAWITRLTDGSFPINKLDTNCSLNQVYNTTLGEISVNFFEMQQVDNWANYDAAIIFHDWDANTFPLASIPQVHVLSFSDQSGEWTKSSWKNAPKPKYIISSKSCYNFEKPIVECLRQLVDPTIQLAEEPIEDDNPMLQQLEDEFNATDAPSNDSEIVTW